MSDGNRSVFIAAMLAISFLAMPVIADDDAGIGGDARDTSSTATYLSAIKRSYYGNLTTGAGDWYSIQLTNNTAIAATLYG